MTWVQRLIALWCLAFVVGLAIRGACETVRYLFRRRRSRRSLAELYAMLDDGVVL